MNALFYSPTVEEWLAIISSRRAELLNPKVQMQALLERTQIDVDLQFDENQYKWEKLAPYTVEKKKQAEADPRILHETNEGSGLRLRDAYKKAGRVTDAGVLEYGYPVEKPYAEEHQEGRANIEKDRPELKNREVKKRKKTNIERLADKLDKEFDERFF